jgi:hypothetical protein
LNLEVNKMMRAKYRQVYQDQKQPSKVLQPRVKVQKSSVQLYNVVPISLSSFKTWETFQKEKGESMYI